MPLGLLVEAAGKGQPGVAMPFSNRAQISFPTIQQAMRTLTEWGVTIRVSDDIYQQHEPGTGDNDVHLFPWHLAWQALLQHTRLDPACWPGERSHKAKNRSVQGVCGQM